MKRCFILAVGFSAFMVAPSQAALITFEGVGDLASIGSFYAPLATFSLNARAIVDSDAGGSGNIANEPSASTTMDFAAGPGVTMDVPWGFTELSFYHAATIAGSASVYSGVGGTGVLIGFAFLPINNVFPYGPGDPTGAYGKWSFTSLVLPAIGKSVVFAGSAQTITFDNVSVNAVPEPATLLLLGAGLTGIALRRRRRS